MRVVGNIQRGRYPCCWSHKGQSLFIEKKSQDYKRLFEIINEYLNTYELKIKAKNNEFLTLSCLIFQTCASKSVDDHDTVSRAYLNRLYGAPPSTVSPDTNLFPTIAVYSVRSCDKGSEFASTLANDIQARLAAILVTLKYVKTAIASRQWTQGYNSTNTKFRDNSFIPLASFKKRYVSSLYF